MKQLSAILVLIFVLTNSSYPQSWVQQNSGTTKTLYAVQFLDDNTGYVAGENGTILKTTNGGANWTPLSSGVNITLSDLCFLNSNTGYVTGDQYILKTTNGGTTWTTQLTAPFNVFYSIWFINENTGWCGGGNRNLFRTTNGGANWTQIFPGYGGALMEDMEFFDANTGLSAGGYNGQSIWKTTDGGSSWNLQFTHPQSIASSSIDMTDQNTGYAAFYNSVWKTTNGGTNWNVTSLDGNMESSTALAFKNSTTGVVVGWQGKSHITTDGGSSWQAISGGGTTYFYGAEFKNNNVWAVGGMGTIVKYSTGGSSASVSVTYPNGGEIFQVGSTQQIRWTSSGINNITLQYSTNNGSFWNGILVSYPASNGSYNWTVPNFPSVQCKIRIADAGNPTLFDESDNSFTISSSGSGNGPIAYYPFNGNANDESGNIRHGTVYGATLTTDRFGNTNKAYSFDGVNDYIDVPGTNNLHLNSGGITLAAWINFTESSSNHAIVGKHISGYGNGYYLSIRPATTPEFYIDSESGLRGSDPLNDGKWHFLTGTYDGSVMKFYIDGVFKTSQNKSYSNLNDSTLRIGVHHQGVAAEYFNGKIDDIRIYNRAIDPYEVYQLYSSELNLGSGLVAAYPFSGNPNDVSGNSRHGVNHGASLTTDRFGTQNSAYQFNGTSSYIDIPGTNSLHLNTAHTLTAWINFTVSSGLRTIVGKHISGYGNGYYLMLRPAPTVEYYVNEETGLQSSGNYNDGNWHFLTGVYDGATMKLYVDGVLKGSQSKTFTNNNDSTLQIGRHHGGVAFDFFEGKIDDIRIYNRALTELEIQILRNTAVVGADEEIKVLPQEYSLLQNFPNPFNPSTVIEYQLPGKGLTKVNIKVFDVLGREVAVLVDGEMTAGIHRVDFNGSGLSSGIYLCRIETKDFSAVRKMILIR